jgi:sporulation protein YlmC with PRC-barrel domain
MDSKTHRHSNLDMQGAQDARGEIAEQAAAAAKAAADRARRGASRLLRAREMSDTTLGRQRTDIRGWQVYSNDAELVGTVSSIFIDARTKAVRYIGVALEGSRSRNSRVEVLVPVGWVSRPDDRQIVVLTALSRAQLSAAPRVSDRPITWADEHATLTVYGVDPSAAATISDLYDHPVFAERRLFGGFDSRVELG